MSAIAGIFYFDFRTTPEADQARLRRVSPHPGSHPIQLSSAPGLLIGQAGSRFELPDNRTMATLPDGSACCWDGRLDNRQSLLLRFGREAGRPGFPSAMAALKLYQEEGADGLRRLIGDWSLAIWDARSKTVVLASDYAGIRPLYYYLGSDRVCWSSSLADLAEWTGTGALDEEYVARFLLSRSVPRRTPYPGVLSVPAGHAVRIRPESSSMEPFWRLPWHQELRLEDDREYEEGLRTLFREAVEVRLRSDSPVCSELSGGLDSSSVVCMSDRLLGPDSPPVTFSYVHAESKDLPYIRAVERHCGIQGIHLDLQEFPLVTADQAGGAAPAWWQPRLAETARRMESMGSGVLLTGQVGDFIMGNLGDDSEQVADYLQERRFGAAMREALAWSQAMQFSFYSIFWRALRTTYSSWTAPALTDVWSGPAGPFTRADSLTARLRALLPGEAPRTAIEEEWRRSAPSRRRRFRTFSQIVEGRTLQTPEPLQHLSYSHPYTHRPLVEFMLTIPAGKVCRPNEPRRLMRKAFASLLPDPIVKRKSKAMYTQPFRQSLLTLSATMAAEPEQILSVAFGYLERDHLLERLRRFSQGLDCNEMQLRQILLFEFWLRNREKRAAPTGGGSQTLQGTTTSTLVPCPGELLTERVAPI